MRFAHMADCHIGSWRDPKLKDASVKAFEKAIDLCIDRNVDFILISGDLFNTSLPAIDNLKNAVQKLKQLKDNDISVYIIAGSHDFSPSGKTMIDVLEKAGLLINVVKGKVIDEKLVLNFTIDKKTGAKITGMLGKKGSLEKVYYKNLEKAHLENEKGYKIFMFHSALTEFKPKDLDKIESHPLSLLPKHFNYYAGGHVHYVFDKKEDEYGLITYPGPLFPNSFKELEDLERGGLYFVEVKEEKIEDTQENLNEKQLPQLKKESKEFNTKIEWEPIQIYNLFKIRIDADNKTSEQIEEEIKEHIKDKELNNTIVTLRIEGVLASGRPSDVNFKDVFAHIYNKSAYFVMKNTNKLTSQEYDEIKVEQSNSVEEIENKLIKEHLGQIKVSGMDTEKEEDMVKSFMSVLSAEKEEGETVNVFEERIKNELDKVLEL